MATGWSEIDDETADVIRQLEPGHLVESDLVQKLQITKADEKKHTIGGDEYDVIWVEGVSNYGGRHGFYYWPDPKVTSNDGEVLDWDHAVLEKRWRPKDYKWMNNSDSLSEIEIIKKLDEFEVTTLRAGRVSDIEFSGVEEHADDSSSSYTHGESFTDALVTIEDDADIVRIVSGDETRWYHQAGSKYNSDWVEIDDIDDWDLYSVSMTGHAGKDVDPDDYDDKQEAVDDVNNQLNTGSGHVALDANPEYHVDEWDDEWNVSLSTHHIVNVFATSPKMAKTLASPDLGDYHSAHASTVENMRTYEEWDANDL